MIIPLLILFSASAYAGNELGNGGDLVAQEFVAAGRKMIQELRKNPDPRIKDVEGLAKAVETVKVTTTESLSLEGSEVDAINLPKEKQIKVSRSRWRDYGASKRASLVLHEYLGILEIKDDQYEISGSYADAFAIPEMRAKKYEVALFTNYGIGQDMGSIYAAKSDRPGLGFFSGYKLSPRSTLGLRLDYQAYADDNYGQATFQNNILEIAAAYRYWLSEGSKLRPYLMGGLGYARVSSDSSYRVSTYETRNYESSYYHDGVTMQGAAGIRYELLNEIGLDLSLHGHQIHGKPGGVWKSLSRFGFAQFGVDVVF